MKKENTVKDTTKPMAYDALLCGVTQENFKQHFKRIIRQLSERATKVKNRQKPDSYYQNKRQEFKQLIDTVIEQGWFTMPPKGTRIWRAYYDVWY